MPTRILVVQAAVRRGWGGEDADADDIMNEGNAAQCFYLAMESKSVSCLVCLLAGWLDSSLGTENIRCVSQQISEAAGKKLKRYNIDKVNKFQAIVCIKLRIIGFI